MLALVIISLMLLITDLTVSSIINKSVVDCLSRCWYVIGWWHYALVMASVLALFPPAIHVTEDRFRFLAFIMCAAMILVGTACDYLGSAASVHKAAAYMAAACAIVWTMLTAPLSTFAMFLSMTGWIDKKRHLLWCEIGAFLAVYICMLIKLLS